MARSALLLALLAALAAGCDSAADDPFEDQIVVSASLEAEMPLPSVRLTRLAPLFEPYDLADVAVSGAEVSVSLLGADGSVERTTPYVEASAFGLYDPLGNVPALPGRTYRLEVTGPAGERLSAETTVPPAFRVVEPPPPSVVYGAGQGPSVRITQTSSAARRAAFVLTARALSPVAFDPVRIDGATRYRSRPESGFLPVPLVRQIADCEDEPAGTLLCDDDPAEDFARGTSPIINEDSYTDLGDGTLRVNIPFIAFGFYGPQEVAFVSIDAALQDFVETQAIQFNPTTLSPGEIPNVTTNVEGGLGVFGSFARASVSTAVTER